MLVTNESNKSNKRYIERFAYSQLTEHEFVAVLLPLLCQNGICKINEDKLQEKLYCYYKDEKFEELFQEIFPIKGINEMRVNLSEGLHREKYHSGNIWFENSIVIY